MYIRYDGTTAKPYELDWIRKIESMAAPSPEEKSIIYNGLRLYLKCKPNKTGSLTPNNCDMKAPITVCFTLAFLAEL